MANGNDWRQDMSGNKKVDATMRARQDTPQATRGVALVSMLAVVALAAVVASIMLEKRQLSIQGAAAFSDQQQAFQYALGGEAYARHLLLQDLSLGTKATERRALWQRWSEAFDIADGELAIQIQDVQGLFNLNSLRHAQARLYFTRLLQALALDTRLVALAHDWLDPNLEAQPAGAEDDSYLLMQPAHRAANQPFYSVSELRLLYRQLDANTFAVPESLKARVVALPVTGPLKININTVEPTVLRAIAPQLSPVVAAAIARSDTQYNTAEALFADYPQLRPAIGSLVFRSDFFRIHTRCRYQNRTVLVSSLVYRDPKAGVVHVLRRAIQGVAPQVRRLAAFSHQL